MTQDKDQCRTVPRTNALTAVGRVYTSRNQGKPRGILVLSNLRVVNVAHLWYVRGVRACLLPAVKAAMLSKTLAHDSHTPKIKL